MSGRMTKFGPVDGVSIVVLPRISDEHGVSASPNASAKVLHSNCENEVAEAVTLVPIKSTFCCDDTTDSGFWIATVGGVPSAIYTTVLVVDCFEASKLVTEHSKVNGFGDNAYKGDAATVQIPSLCTFDASPGHGYPRYKTMHSIL